MAVASISGKKRQAVMDVHLMAVGRIPFRKNCDVTLGLSKFYNHIFASLVYKTQHQVYIIPFASGQNYYKVTIDMCATHAISTAYLMA